jgi:nickel transport protein
MKPFLLSGLIGLTGLLLFPQQARAHGIESSLERLSSLNDDLARTGTPPTAQTLRLESHFSNGLPASDAAVRVVPTDGGTPIALGRTDAAGRIVFTLPPQANRQWEVQVDAGPGHRDYLELPEPGSSPSAAAQVSRSRPYALLEGWATALPLGLLAGAGLAGLVWHRRHP